MSDPRGFGGLYRKDVEQVDLGEHAGYRLRARVEHRTVRVALGSAGTGSVTLGQRRARALEVAVAGAPPGASFELVLPRPTDPRMRLAWRTAAVAVLGWAVLQIAARARR